MIASITNGNQPYRSRPRTYPYFTTLPYTIESQDDRLDHLNHIITNLYLAIEGDELKGVISAATGAAVSHWTRELRSWLELKFDMPLETRIKLIRLYYNLALSGCDFAATNTFVNMFCVLSKDEQFQDTVDHKDLDFDWKLLVRSLKSLAFSPSGHTDQNSDKMFTAFTHLSQVARQYFDPNDTIEILEEILPTVGTTWSNADLNVRL